MLRPPALFRALIILAVLLPMGAVVLCTGPMAPAPALGERATPPGRHQAVGVTTEGYPRVREGMALVEVQAVLGGPGEEVEGLSYPFCTVGSPMSIRGKWRVWRAPRDGQRWIAAKFGDY